MQIKHVGARDIGNRLADSGHYLGPASVRKVRDTFNNRSHGEERIESSEE
jgi:hypothetical protein